MPQSPLTSRTPPPDTTLRSDPVAADVPRRRLLVVEDNELARQQLQKFLEQDAHVTVDTAADGRAALKRLEETNYSLLITDLRMPDIDGMQLIKESQRRGLPVTIIVTTGHGSIDEAVQATRLGAYEFLTKPIDLENLNRVVQRALRERALQDEVQSLRAQLQTNFAFDSLLSKNPRMHAVFALIRNVADSNATVLIEGETGTGKELVARAIHHASQRRGGPLVAVNCAALPEALLESELFGHEKGAFTSAVGQRLGRFELANAGTIFLDEVGDIPAAMQAKLLRVLQERRFERVGGTESIEVDVRVIAATNRSLHRLVRRHKFREDLYYRLNVVRIELPPLRDRPEDIPLLATHFAQKYTPASGKPKQLCAPAMELLMSYPWPGNIRELENAIERACVTAVGEIILPENLPPEILAPPTPVNPYRITLDRPLPEVLRQVVAAVEREYLRRALKKARGHVARCARICGLSRRSISSKLAEYQLDKESFRAD